MEQNTSLPSPLQIEVLEFNAYDLVIDARTPREYGQDHIPGSVNLPVVDDAQFAEVGIKHVEDKHAAYLIGADYALTNIAEHIRIHLSKYSADARFLVYCFRGGKRSRVWADTLRSIGFTTDVLKGGWKRYRQWVRDGLESLPQKFEYCVISGSTGCGKTRLLHALEHVGEQTLNLEGIASHRGSLLGAVPGQAQPTQKFFDTLLLNKLRSFDLRRPIWIEAESKKIGNIQIPDALYEAMGRSMRIEVSAPMHDRVQLLREDYVHFVREPDLMVQKLEPLKPLVGNDEVRLWQALAREGRVDELFERVIVAHYDPSYARAKKRPYRQPHEAVSLILPSLDTGQLNTAAQELSKRFGHALKDLPRASSPWVNKPDATALVQLVDSDFASNVQELESSTNAIAVERTKPTAAEHSQQAAVAMPAVETICSKASKS
jgi:tRNA 2-selenouridine synthase